MRSAFLRAFFIIFAIVVIAGAKEYDFQRHFAKKWHVNRGEVIVLDNPVGEIHLSNTDPKLGSFVMVKQRVYAAFDELVKSRRMVMMVRLDATRRPDSLKLFVQFPMHMFERYKYPDMGGFFTSEVDGIWQGKKITVSPKKGVKLWSDIYIQIPAGQKIVINSIAATFVIEDFVGDIDFTTDHASAMTAGDIRGNLFLTACHGALSVSKFSGDLFYDGEDSDISFCDVIRGTVRAKSTSGDILWNAKCDSAEKVELESLSGKIMYNGELAKCTCLINDEGKIEITPTSFVQDSLIATTSGGDIVLEMPENYAHEISASSKEGRVKHKFDNIDSDNNVSVILKGKSGSVVLRSERGTIKLNIRSSR